MDEKEFQQEIKGIEKKVASVIIESKETFEFVQQGIIRAKAIKKQIDEYFKSMQDPAYDAWKAICNRHTEMVKPVVDFINKKTKESSDYLTLQEKKRKEFQAKADEEKRKKEESEKAKLEKKAEKAEAAGDTVKAEAIREQADMVYHPPVIVQAEVEKTTRIEAGTISQIKDIDIRIIDEKKLVEAIARGDVPLSVISINIVKLKQFIKLNQLTKLDGCEIVERITSRVRAAK